MVLKYTTQSKEYGNNNPEDRMCTELSMVRPFLSIFPLARQKSEPSLSLYPYLYKPNRDFGNHDSVWASSQMLRIIYSKVAQNYS
jgi:hypothetical protein